MSEQKACILAPAAWPTRGAKAGGTVNPPDTMQQQGESHTYRIMAESCTSVLDSAMRLFMCDCDRDCDCDYLTVTVSACCVATIAAMG